MQIQLHLRSSLGTVSSARIRLQVGGEAQTIIANLGPPPPSVAKARSVLRHEWQPNRPTARRIETAVQQFLS